MSYSTEILARDIVEAVMLNSLDALPDHPKEDTQYDLGVENNLEDTSYPGMTITEILHKVAVLAEGLEEALQDFQIGDYVVSMNTSPLEIQVKQAICNFELAENLIMIPKGVSNGEGDGERQVSKLADDPKVQEQPDESGSMAAEEHRNGWNLEPLQDFHNEVIGTLKRKKRMGIVERLRRILRFTFSRRRNS